ncbi:green fluorescent protein-like isoform X1 [Clytia hemisphaerica]|uniref:Green fluorescent protein n=1 Tax=Clytia hemisphaerica TaxID=252671 RepID=J9PGT0_9CNID|nr:green fluorescent protein [Clytia hemisphaerica]
MASAGALLLNQRVPFIMELDAEVNGIRFAVRGKGTGDATTGIIDTKFVCTTGKLPVPWASISSTMAYGALCFAKYPDSVKDFFKSAMPDGYIQEKTISFENDGAYKVRGVITYEHGSIYNRVTLKGEGFKKDGLILQKQYEFCCPNSAVYVLPDKENNGLRVVYNTIYKLKDGGHHLAAHEQQNTPLGGGVVDIPNYHHIHAGSIFSKDLEETRDHMCLVETVRAVNLETYN